MCNAVLGGLFGGLGTMFLGGQMQAGKAGAEAQDRATAAATEQAAKTADAADQAYNRANGKQPNVASLDAGNAQAARGGVSGTLLTGPQGVDPKSLLLGKTTLLGG
jgi:hypothetical protein